MTDRLELLKQQNINEAEGEAIRSVAQATADGIRQVAQAIQVPGRDAAHFSSGNPT